MMIKIRLFAAAKQFAGTDVVEIPANQPISVATLSDKLIEQHSELASLMPFVRFAIDSEYVDSKTLVDPGTEVAVIPPVSGG